MYSENVYNHVLAGSFDELDYLIDNTEVEVNSVLYADGSVNNANSFWKQIKNPTKK